MITRIVDIALVTPDSPPPGLNDHAPGQVRVGTQIVMQHRGHPAGAQQGAVVLIEVVGDEHPAATTLLLERAQCRDVAAADRVHRTDLRMRMGLGSAGETHLDRLVDFGNAHCYEARQVRRYSDLGIQQLAELITSNWIVHAVPTLEVFAAHQSNGSWAITLRATHPNLIEMASVDVLSVDGQGHRAPVEANLTDRGSTDRVEVHTLAEPFVLAAAKPGVPRHLRFEWKGEVWPRFVLNVVGPLAASTVFTSQTLGNPLQLSVEVLAP